MKDFSIDLIWAKVQIAITALGGWLGYFLGGMDGLMIELIVLMTLVEYVTVGKDKTMVFTLIGGTEMKA